MIAISTSTLLNYFSAQQSLVLSRAATKSSSSSSSRNSSSASTSTAPWNEKSTETTEAKDAKVLSTTDYVDTSNVPPAAVSTADKLEQDNQKLYSIYKALDTLEYFSEMASRDDVASGVIAGYNKRFQSCLSQIAGYVSKTKFNNLELQQAALDAVTTGTAAISSSNYDYTTKTLTNSETADHDLAGVDTSDSFKISVKKSDGTNSDVTINMADVKAAEGSLSLSNIAAYVNEQLKNAGLSTRFGRVQTGSSTDKKGNITYDYALKVSYAIGETVSLSSVGSTPALILTGTSGLTKATKDTAADNASRLVKLSLAANGGDISASAVSSSQTVTGGTSSAAASATDNDGNTYILGTTNGNVAGEINQSTDKDVYLSKYDSAGHLLWSHLMGSSADADGYGLAIDPTGGVVVVGSTTSDLTTCVAEGNDDSFVAKFSSRGDEKWVTQLNTRLDNAAKTVSVSSDGTVVVGGTISKSISSSETTKDNDAYLMQISNKGKIVAKQQFGTGGNDTVAASGYDNSGNLYVVTTESGHAVLNKYAAGPDGAVDVTAAPTWSQDLGDIGLSGEISDIAISGNGIYISGNASNGTFADGTVPVANASSGGTDAFVYKLTDDGSGSAATPNYVTYVGTGGKDTAGALAVASDGTVYLTGTTDGTFEGNTRDVDKTTNTFVTSIDGRNGTVAWTKQYGGLDGQSTGVGIAVDEDGAGVLDALGLPTGTVEPSVVTGALTDETTVKVGDTFKIGINSGTSTRTTTVTITKGETLRSLVSDINSRLGSAGTASISYGTGGKSLKIESSSGYTLKLIPGSDGADALAGLGIAKGTLSDGSAVVSSGSNTKTLYGIGLSSDLNFSTKTEAAAVKAQVKNAMSAVQKIYQAINSKGSKTSSSTSKTSPSTNGAYTNYLAAKTTDASIALSILA